MSYREEKEVSKIYKQRYVEGLEQLIKKRQQASAVARNAYFEHCFDAPDRYRADFRAMLGWPLVGHEENRPPAVTAELLSTEEGYCIYRMQITILDDLTLTGLFFKIDGEEKKPLVIVQHGGLGTPELISGLYEDTANYNHMLERTIRQGVHAFAPQLLLWDDSYAVSFNRQEIDAKLKRVGSSITAVEIYGILRCLDYFEAQDYVSSLGMLGLSYGGFYTLFTAAIDTRIRSAVSCCFFNTRDQYPWIDWTWFGAAGTFDDAEVACLVYPRKLYLQIGRQDGLFDYTYGIESFEKLKKICEKVGTDWVDFTVFDGEHEFPHEDIPIEHMIKDLTATD